MAGVQDIQDWGEVFKELSDLLLEKVPELKWADMWMEQTNHEAEEYPFRTPAVFLSFEAQQVDELGEQVQELNMLVHVILCFNTLQDTHAKNPEMRGNALRFIGIMRKIHEELHGHASEHHSALTRVGLRQEAAPAHVILYSQTYSFILWDHGASPRWGEHRLNDQRMSIEEGQPPAAPQPPFYHIEGV